jgi:hypothetical protein
MKRIQKPPKGFFSKKVKSECVDDKVLPSLSKTTGHPPLPLSNVKTEDNIFPGFSVVHSKPTRSGDGIFTFHPAQDETDKSVIDLISKFHPNKSPSEILKDGAFGGTYFRKIKSQVCNNQIFDNAWKELPKEWIEGLDPKIYLNCPFDKYNKNINKYKVKSGTTLEDWESSGWISPIDPFGWFQWYCRFFQGRRSYDDARQIDRWLKCCGLNGRWKLNLCTKIDRAGTTYNDFKVSPVVRQTLLHWAYELTEHDYQEFKQLKKN